ncbi:uncharacterized protein K489DRAFT_227566 [Dissoconium aciculare CBS 342.82]|uniref:Uncharacterized protein n=1 Tax=Dissoconium aciculare CBS 342.82 TaxID=1314786 RepID=A0A6J3M6S1_9PEZI|nr:uncharacterized protein K489DRAFT_227566 [Dissoconium aciculare CBS 342.82]KAF1823214.1 hypothetical protein K489DRAFT_227566 [Dissoconium aciculare CBS 342.82]
MFPRRSIFSRLARRFPKPRHIQFSCVSSTNARATCLEFCEDFLQNKQQRRTWLGRQKIRSGNLYEAGAHRAGPPFVEIGGSRCCGSAPYAPDDHQAALVPGSISATQRGSPWIYRGLSSGEGV